MKISRKEIDNILAKKFPNNMYKHNVDDYLAGNGSGYSQLCVGDVNETKIFVII